MKTHHLFFLSLFVITACQKPKETASQLQFTIDAFDVAQDQMEVTFKVNTEEIDSLLAMLQRHEYTVQSFHNAPEVEDEMRARFDAFMRYLEP